MDKTGHHHSLSSCLRLGGAFDRVALPAKTRPSRRGVARRVPLSASEARHCIPTFQGASLCWEESKNRTLRPNNVPGIARVTEKGLMRIAFAHHTRDLPALPPRRAPVYCAPIPEQRQDGWDGGEPL